MKGSYWPVILAVTVMALLVAGVSAWYYLTAPTIEEMAAAPLPMAPAAPSAAPAAASPAPRLTPAEIESLMAQARKSTKAGDYSGALANWSEALSAAEATRHTAAAVSCATNMARIYEQAGVKKTAEEHYLIVLKYKPDDLEALYYLGAKYYDLETNNATPVERSLGYFKEIQRQIPYYQDVPQRVAALEERLNFLKERQRQTEISDTVPLG